MFVILSEKKERLGLFQNKLVSWNPLSEASFPLVTNVGIRQGFRCEMKITNFPLHLIYKYNGFSRHTKKPPNLWVTQEFKIIKAEVI